MNPYITGTLVFVAAVIIFTLAFMFQQKGKTTIALCLLIAGSATLKIYSSADMFLHEWDERYHALVAKNLSEHPLRPTLYEHPVLPYNPSSWGSNHIWVHKQPIPLWQMAICIKLFGTNEWAVRLPSIITSLIGIILIFHVAAYFFNRKTAFIAAFLLSISGIVTDLVSGRIATDHIDAIFLFYTLLTTFFIIRHMEAKKHYFLVLAGLSLGCALMTKWLPALVCLPVTIILMRYTHRYTWTTICFRITVIVLCAAAIVAPWHIYINKAFPLETALEYSHMSRHITEYLDGHKHHILYHFDMLRIIYGELVYLPMAWFTCKALKYRAPKHLALCAWFWIVYLFFTIVATKMQAYTIITAPAIFIITAFAFTKLMAYRKRLKYPSLAAIVAILFIALPIRYTIERVSFFAPKERAPQWSEHIKKWSYPSGSVIFNCPHPIEAMFYHNYTVYEHVPEKNVLDSLSAKGYNVVVLP